MKDKTKLNFFLISDASGETVATVAKAVVSFFETEVLVTEYLFPMVRSKASIDNIIENIGSNNANLILYTMVDSELRTYLVDRCNEVGIAAIFALEHVIKEIAKFIGIEIKATGLPGKYKKLDENYYKKIDIINFTLQHDDGSDFSDVNEADVLILGVSRTSKSPTSLYLAQHGYKTANLPIIYGVEANISHINKPLIVGFVIAADILIRIRASRFASYNFIPNEFDSYADFDSIKQELDYSINLFHKNQIPIIDVTKKAVEEVAAEIINLYAAKKGGYKILL
jgi:regulator of PEP synthase PpsR (kinase-PPPase family)